MEIGFSGETSPAAVRGEEEAGRGELEPGLKSDAGRG